MNFIEANKSFLAKFATFKGRAPRSEYWWATASVFLFSIILIALGIEREVAKVLLILIIGLPYSAVCVRRCHDTGKSGWFLFIPLYPIYLLGFAGSENKTNQHGPCPSK
jgi:uncharacterized membrane protein YhaH (DUF805 family)